MKAHPQDVVPCLRLLDEAGTEQDALATAGSDLRGKIHPEELALMVARLALFRLGGQRTALDRLIRQQPGCGPRPA